MVRVKLLKDTFIGETEHKSGEIVDVTDATAKEWIDAGIATSVEEKPVTPPVIVEADRQQELKEKKPIADIKKGVPIAEAPLTMDDLPEDHISMKDLPDNVQKKMRILVGTSGKSSETLLKEFNEILSGKDIINLKNNLKYEKAYARLYNQCCKTKMQVPVINDGKQIAVLHITGRNKWRIDDNKGEIIIPERAGSKDRYWYESVANQREIQKKFQTHLNLSEIQAEKIRNILCANVAEKIKKLEQKGFFKKHIEEDLQIILDSITSVSLIGNPDGNIYHIVIEDQTIQLTDKQLYNEPIAFCIKYLTCFKKKIEITPEEWNEHFIPTIQSEDILETETEKIESTCDMITQKFIFYIKNTDTYDWKDMATRENLKKCMFFDTQHDWVMVSREFIDDFFIREKITRDYKKTQGDWNSYLHRKEDRYLIEKSRTGRTKNNKVKRFWVFDPMKIEISKDKIKKKEEPKENELQKPVDKYYNIKPVGD